MLLVTVQSWQEFSKQLQEQQEQQTIEIERTAEKQANIETRMEMLHKQQEIHTQLQQEVLEQHAIENERMSQEQGNFENRMDTLEQQVQEMQVVSQKQAEIETQLTQKKTKSVSTKRKSHLVGMTRQKALNPQAQLFYKKVIKLEREQKRLKLTIRKMKDKQKSTRIILSTTDHKGRKDKTALIRQQLIDMIVRHDKVPPQVYS